MDAEGPLRAKRLACCRRLSAPTPSSGLPSRSGLEVSQTSPKVMASWQCNCIGLDREGKGRCQPELYDVCATMMTGQSSCLYACQQSYIRPMQDLQIPITSRSPYKVRTSSKLLVPLTPGRTLHNGQNRVFCLVHRGFICPSAPSPYNPSSACVCSLTSSDSNQIIVLPDLDVRTGVGPQTRDGRALGPDDPRER
jgi:hypothetical protein